VILGQQNTGATRAALHCSHETSFLVPLLTQQKALLLEREYHILIIIIRAFTPFSVIIMASSERKNMKITKMTKKYFSSSLPLN
jgi:hypothetical protein